MLSRLWCYSSEPSYKESRPQGQTNILEMRWLEKRHSLTHFNTKLTTNAKSQASYEMSELLKVCEGSQDGFHATPNRSYTNQPLKLGTFADSFKYI